MQLKNKINQESGFRYCIENLKLQSSLGRNYIMTQSWCKDPQTLYAEWDAIERVCELLRDSDSCRHIEKVKSRLTQVHDLKVTITNISEGNLLDDVQLFEIKNLALLSLEITDIAKKIGISSLFSIPDLTEVLQLLDPDNTGIANFYIYDSYDPRLFSIRFELKKRTAQLSAHKNTLSEEESMHIENQIAYWFDQDKEVEEKVRKHLTTQLQPYAEQISGTLHRLAYIDALQAKAQQAVQWNLCKPAITIEQTSYKGLFNPRLKEVLHQQNRTYQSITIELTSGVCLITGANMGGKTVLLKTVGTAQLLAQYAFFLPAEQAEVVLVEDVAFCIGDEQNEMNGLSSFASEMLKINEVIKKAKQHKLLILIDELARTTNPAEGKAIVQSVTDFLNHRHSYTLVTTHYSKLGLTCRKLRVKGFMEPEADEKITPSTINRFMDYTLVEDTSENVPHEALRIAEILGCESEIILSAKHFLKEE